MANIALLPNQLRRRFTRPVNLSRRNNSSDGTHTLSSADNAQISTTASCRRGPCPSPRGHGTTPLGDRVHGTRVRLQRVPVRCIGAPRPAKKSVYAGSIRPAHTSRRSAPLNRFIWMRVPLRFLHRRNKCLNSETAARTSDAVGISDAIDCGHVTALVQMQAVTTIATMSHPENARQQRISSGGRY